jgi:predicted acyltransferase
MTARYKSLDIFRGMTVAMMILVNTPGSWSYIYPPLQHAPWHGYTPTDLVFPFFLIAIGLSMTFSFEKYDQLDQKAFYLKTTRRAILIFLIGLALTAFPFIGKDYSHLRILGVLQRIALTYYLGAIIIHHFNNVKKLLWLSISILLGYWLVLLAFGTGDPFSLETNFPRTIDLYILGDAHMWHGHTIAFDPEGFLSTLPAVVSVIFGYLLGQVIKKYQGMNLLAHILLIGNILVITGYIWGMFIPINKALWTSSYVLVTTGIAAVILGILIYLVDIKNWSKWATPFIAFGMNPLIIFILSILWVKTYFIIHIGDQNMYSWLYTTVFKPIVNPTFGSLLFALFHVFGSWLVANILYKRKIFIKL